MEQSSTGAMALTALHDDPEIIGLVLEIGRLYSKEEAKGLVQSAIERTLSTSALTAEFGVQRPGGLEFFKLELENIIRARG